MELRVLENFEYLCSQDAPPVCQSHCPIQVEAGSMVAQVASGHLDEARKNLERNMPLAGLSGYLCEGPCQSHCLRKDLDSPVNLPLIERQVVSQGRAIKPFAMPGTKNKVAIIGSALSGLVCAQCLALKGNKATVFHHGPIGAALNDLPPEKLPKKALEEAVSLLKFLKVDFKNLDISGQIQGPGQGPGQGPDQAPELAKPPISLKLADLLAQYSAVFLALDDAWLGQIGYDPQAFVADAVTRGSSEEKLFLGPTASERKFFEAISAGKKAAASMDRLFQGVLPSSAREKEMVGPTRLVVDLSNRPIIPAQILSQPLAATAQEVTAEAQRCLQCSCLSCLPPCPLLRSHKGYPKKYAREFYNNIITAFGIRHSNRYINSCAECGLCGQLCPNGADLGAFVSLARLDMVSSNHMPASAHEFALEDQEFSNSPEIAFLRQPPGRDRAKSMFFPGCQLLGAYPETTLKTYQYLNENLEGSVGLWSGCCGAPGRWSGRKILTGKTSQAFREKWREIGQPTIILACPSCELYFKSQLPEIPIKGLWPVLDGLPKPPAAQCLKQTMVIHDPCSARLDFEGQKAVRSVMTKLGQKFIEPKMTGRFTLCCGYGGLVSEAQPEMGRAYLLERSQANPEPILAWCSVCRDRFLAEDHGALHPLDLLFPPNNLEEKLTAKAPGISAKRSGREYFRNLALSAIWHEASPPQETTMALNIDIPGSVLADMESKRLLVSDVTAVLEMAQKNGPVFVNPETGHKIANHRPRQVT
ncbi:MAG: 4Fe-4S dicluster domain-containing protein, partial [Deltaproteobacteria bacterium]|nr:4Fe-4S dicluster domain-containing protein [Deltaproteobacteria bacterium]